MCDYTAAKAHYRQTFAQETFHKLDETFSKFEEPILRPE